MSNQPKPKAIQITDENLPVIRELVGEQYYIGSTNWPRIKLANGNDELLYPGKYVIIKDRLAIAVVSYDNFHLLRAIAEAVIL